MPVVESVILPAHAGGSCAELKKYDGDNPDHVERNKFCSEGNVVECQRFIDCMLAACIDTGGDC